MSAHGTCVSHYSCDSRLPSELREGRAQVCLARVDSWSPSLTLRNGCELLEVMHEWAWAGVSPWRTQSGSLRCLGPQHAVASESWKSGQNPAGPPWELGGIAAVPRAAKCRQYTVETLAGESLRVPKASRQEMADELLILGSKCHCSGGFQSPTCWVQSLLLAQTLPKAGSTAPTWHNDHQCYPLS